MGITTSIRLSALALLTFLPQPALAKLSPFVLCDLHAAPRGKSDGREIYDARAAIEVRPLPIVDRIQACTDALAMPELTPGLWARRTDLLEARAVLELANKQRDPALADLDAATTLGQLRASDRFYTRSAGLGIRMLRALVMLDGPGAAEAQRQWAEIGAERPFDGAVQIAVFRALWSSDAPYALTAPTIDRLQRLSLDGTLMVVDGLLDMGHAREAVMLFDAIPTRSPDAAALVSDGDGVLVKIAKRLTFIELQLRIAYAKAAMGDATGAHALIDSARLQGESWAGDVPTSGGPAKALAQYHVTHDSVANQVQRGVKTWSDMIAARAALDAHRTVDLQPLMAENALFAREQLDLLKAVNAVAPNGDVVARAEMIRVRLAEQRKNRLDPGGVYALRPPAESGANMTPFHASHGMLHGGTGWKAEPNADGTVAVTFTGYVPSQAVSEMALLGAAVYTQAAARPGFVVEQTSSFVMGKISTGAQSDQNVNLTIRLVNDLADPRALSATSVQTTLAPVFDGVTGPM